MKKSCLYIFSLCVIHSVNAQHLHWSQPVTALHYINPAFTGVSGKFSANAGYRSQWNAVHSSYRTSYFSGDYRLGGTKNPELLNLGAFFYNDLQGGGSLRVNCPGITASSHIKAGQNVSLGAGISYQRINTTLITNQYSWGNQYTGERYDPTLPSGEKSETLYAGYTNIQAGICYIYQEGKDQAETSGKRKFLAGYSADHLTRPVSGVAGGADRLRMKHSLYLQAYLPADPARALKPFLLFQAQGPMMECTIGALFRTAFGEVSRFTGIKRGAGFSLGASYRVMDALIPTFEYEKDNIIIGISYDLNISKLTTVSYLRGGTEISLRLTPKRSAPLPTVKPATPSTRSMEGF